MLLNVFIYNILISIFGFGSGAVFISYVYYCFVNTSIITNDTFNMYVAITESLPGPTSIKILTLINYNIGGLLFCVITIIAFIIPTMCFIYLAIKVLNYQKTIKFFDLVGILFTPVLSAIIISLVLILIFKNITGVSGGILLIFLTIVTYMLKKMNITNSFILILINIIILVILQNI